MAGVRAAWEGKEQPGSGKLMAEEWSTGIPGGPTCNPSSPIASPEAGKRHHSSVPKNS